jgi:hypothetical protein
VAASTELRDLTGRMSSQVKITTLLDEPVNRKVHLDRVLEVLNAEISTARNAI